jgi:hypothetical protein
MKRLGLPALSFLLLAGVAGAFDYPYAKEGLWTIHTKDIENPGNKVTERDYSICRNHAYEDYVRSRSKRSECKTLQENLSGSVFTTENECTLYGTVIHSVGKTVFTGDSASHTESHSTFAPASFGRTESATIIDEKYVGSCPTNMQPGDSMTKDGRIVHLWHH